MSLIYSRIGEIAIIILKENVKRPRAISCDCEWISLEYDVARIGKKNSAACCRRRMRIKILEGSPIPDELNAIATELDVWLSVMCVVMRLRLPLLQSNTTQWPSIQSVLLMIHCAPSEWR